MKIVLKTVWISHGGLAAQEKGSVRGEIQFDEGLTIEFNEDLLPEELEYIRDGLSDLTQRIKERTLNAIRALDETKPPAKKKGRTK